MIFSFIFFAVLVIALSNIFPRQAQVLFNFVTGKKEISSVKENTLYMIKREGSCIFMDSKFEYYPRVEELFFVDLEPFELKFKIDGNENEFTFLIQRNCEHEILQKMASLYGSSILNSNEELEQLYKAPLIEFCNQNKDTPNVRACELKLEGIYILSVNRSPTSE